MEKPYSPACERNREPILAILRERFSGCQHILEIGSGTGQHAVHFATAMPHLVWQSADRSTNLPGIHLWLDEAKLPNTPSPLVFDINDAWPVIQFDGIFSANTLHIMHWSEVEKLFAGLPTILKPNGTVVIYGPFNYQNHYTSTSNAAFDASLKSQGQGMGIRDFEAVFELAAAAGLMLLEDHAMPANNRCLVWQAKG